MAIVRIQERQFIPCDQIDDVIKSISLNEQEKNGFSYTWQCFRQFLDKAQRKQEHMLKSCLRAT